jgi:hypothetical protein
VVTRQVGPLQSRLERDPDIVIRFVDSLPVPSRIRYLGVDDAGFTDDAFLVLRGPHKSRARAQIPFDRVGKQCEIVCERGLLQVPLLIPILNLTVLGKGTLPLHASAFSYRDTGFVATGWSRSGKPEVLLGFMANGASYVSDEFRRSRAAAGGHRLLPASAIPFSPGPRRVPSAFGPAPPSPSAADACPL